MRRRQVLGVAAGVGMLGLSGCLESLPVVGDGQGGSTTVETVAILDHTIAYTESSQSEVLFATVTGEAVNTTESSLPTAIIQATFLDSEGEAIAANVDPFTDIPPADTFEFDIQFPTPQSRPRMAQNIDSYELTVRENLNGTTLSPNDPSVSVRPPGSDNGAPVEQRPDRNTSG